MNWGDHGIPPCHHCGHDPEDHVEKFQVDNVDGVTYTLRASLERCLKCNCPCFSIRVSNPRIVRIEGFK